MPKRRSATAAVSALCRVSKLGAASTKDCTATPSVPFLMEQLRGRFSRSLRAEQNLNDPSLANDVLFGAGEISAHLFGEDTRQNRRKVYYLASRRLPCFRMGGSRLCCRRSTLLQFIAAQEQRNGALKERND